MNSYLLIDLSYMIFFRYYAILSWYKKAFPDDLELNQGSRYTDNIKIPTYFEKF